MNRPSSVKVQSTFIPYLDTCIKSPFFDIFAKIFLKYFAGRLNLGEMRQLRGPKHPLIEHLGRRFPILASTRWCFVQEVRRWESRSSFPHSTKQAVWPAR